MPTLYHYMTGAAETCFWSGSRAWLSWVLAFLSLQVSCHGAPRSLQRVCPCVRCSLHIPITLSAEFLITTEGRQQPLEHRRGFEGEKSPRTASESCAPSCTAFEVCDGDSAGANPSRKRLFLSPACSPFLCLSLSVLLLRSPTSDFNDIPSYCH